jgi:hypothetical protein
VFYGSNLHKKDNPRWPVSNAAVTPKVPITAFRLLLTVGCAWDEPAAGPPSGLAGVADVARNARRACGVCTAWLIGLPRRAGAWLHAATDEEASRWHWQVCERYGGLVHQYRDERFAILRRDPSIRRDELSVDAAPPACPCGEEL